MSLFRYIIKQIVMCVFFSSIIELVISEKSYKKYIKLFMGLLLIIVMIPNSIQLNNALKINLENHFENKFEQLKKVQEDKTNKYQDKLIDNYEKVIIQEIKEKYNEVNLVRLKSKYDSKEERMDIQISLKIREDNLKNNKGQVREQIKKIVGKYYDVMEEQIEIRFL